MPIYHEHGDYWTCPVCGQTFVSVFYRYDGGKQNKKLTWITLEELEADIAEVAAFLGMVKSNATP